MCLICEGKVCKGMIEPCKNITQFPELSEDLTELYINKCPELQLPAKWPVGLKRLNIVNMNWQTIPPLPDGLIELTFFECSKIILLPKLPNTLKVLKLIKCINLVNPEKITPNLTELHINYMLWETLPILPEGLEILDCKDCPWLLFVGELPVSVKWIDCRNCTMLQSICRSNTETIYCDNCVNLIIIGEQRKLFAISCNCCPKLTYLPIAPELIIINHKGCNPTNINIRR